MGDKIALLGMTTLFASFVIGLFFRDFRTSYRDWMTLKDPLGLKFWAQNTWFLAMCIFGFSLALLGILLQG